MIVDDGSGADVMVTIAAWAIAGCAVVASLLLFAVLVALFFAVCSVIRGQIERWPRPDPPTVPMQITAPHPTEGPEDRRPAPPVRPPAAGR